MGKRRQGLNVYAASLALWLLASCSSQDSVWGGSDDEGPRRPLAVASLQAPVSSPLTRVTTSPLPADGEVGFFVLADAPHYAATNNKKGVYKESESLWVPTDSIWLSRTAAKLALYYPYDAAQTAAGKLNLTASVRPADGSKDLSSARFEADSHTKNISLTLTQLYSRLSVTFVKIADAEYTGTSDLTALKLEGAGIYPTATYAFADGAYAYAATTGYTATLSPAVTIKGTNAAAADATKVDLLLPPYPTLTEDIALTATVDTKEMKIIIPKAKLGNALEAGKQYNITVKLKPTALVLGSVKTTDWDSQTAFDEEAKMESFPEHAIEVKGLDFYVADGNVVATKQLDGTYTYAFAEEQGYYSGIDKATYDPSGGDYFCWNTLAPDAITSSNTTGVWDPDNDPCRKIGDGLWYTPEQAQLQALIDAGYVGGEEIYTMKDGTKVNGCYFGTSSLLDAEAEQDKYIFLPAAGNCFSASWSGVGSFDNYWSSTPSSSSHTYYLDFDSYYCEIGVYSISHDCGLSLRCVRDK